MGIDETRQTPMRRKLIGRRLKFAREQANIPLRHSGIISRVGSTRTAQRLEAGEATQLTFPVIGSLCDLYGIPEEEKFELERLWDLGPSTTWIQQRKSRPLGFSAFFELEIQSNAVVGYESNYVPGWMQTANYMRRLFRSNSDLSRGAIKNSIDQRTARQPYFWEAKNRTYDVLLSETVLRSGCDRAQINRIMEASELDHVTIKYLPLGPPPPPTLLLPFRILSFPTPGDADIAFTDALAAFIFFEEDTSVKYYRQAYEAGEAIGEPMKGFKL
jgi:hypothetical protein